MLIDVVGTKVGTVTDHAVIVVLNVLLMIHIVCSLICTYFQIKHLYKLTFLSTTHSFMLSSGYHVIGIILYSIASMGQSNLGALVLNLSSLGQ